MTIEQLVKELQTYPKDMNVKIIIDHDVHTVHNTAIHTGEDGVYVFISSFD